MNAVYSYYYKTNSIIHYITAHYNSYSIHSGWSLTHLTIFSKIHHVIFHVLNMLFPYVLVFVVYILPVILEGSCKSGRQQSKWIENSHLLHYSYSIWLKKTMLQKPMEADSNHMNPQICTYSSMSAITMRTNILCLK